MSVVLASRFDNLGKYRVGELLGSKLLKSGLEPTSPISVAVEAVPKSISSQA
jgi:hypothetical protein